MLDLDDERAMRAANVLAAIDSALRSLSEEFGGPLGEALLDSQQRAQLAAGGPIA